MLTTSPGITLKLVPNGTKLEVRVKGPTVTPGYLKRPDLTKAAFDEEGFYSLGDAAKFVDENDPEKGLVFDGRVTEDFKLKSGTWVSTGTLRAQAVAAASPLIQDCVVCGQDKEFVALLAWPNLAAAREICGDMRHETPEEILSSPKVVAFVTGKFAAFNAASGESSMNGDPGSSSAAMRSRASSLPALVCLSRAAGVPPRELR